MIILVSWSYYLYVAEVKTCLLIANCQKSFMLVKFKVYVATTQNSVVLWFMENTLHEWCLQVTAEPMLIYTNNDKFYDADRKEWVVYIVLIRMFISMYLYVK